MRSFLVRQPSSTALRALNYAPELERIRQSRSASAVRLETLLSAIGDSYWSVFTRRDCAPDLGVELLTQTDMFSAEPAGRVIRRDSMPNPDLHKVQRWQVLVAGAGQMGDGNLFGRSIIADGRLTHGYLGPHAVAMTFLEPGGVENLWTYAYLNSTAGLAAIKTAAFGTSVPGLRIDRLRDIPVPIPDKATMDRVAALVRSVVQLRERFLTSVNAARSLVNALPDVAEAHELCMARRRSSVMWSGPLPSLCAWNFAAGGGAVALLQERWRTRLRDILPRNGVFNGPRFARIDCSPPHGIEFYSQRDVFMVRPVPRRIVRPDVPSTLLFVPSGALLVGSHGQMTDGSIFGRVELASLAGPKTGVTQDILRVLVQDDVREVAYAFLSTAVGQWLLKSTAIGTSIPLMRGDLLEGLPFPDPGTLPIADIRRHVLNGEKARIEAQTAEREAIRIVEEEVLPQWLA